MTDGSVGGWVGRSVGGSVGGSDFYFLVLLISQKLLDISRLLLLVSLEEVLKYLLCKK